MIKKITVFLFLALLPFYSYSSETASWLSKVPVIDGFLEDQYTAYFSDIPIFIFHGKKD